MKKHDFESKSKKNAKEQTPEMAEREQEILMWMGGGLQALSER